MSLLRSCRTATVQIRGFSSSFYLRVGPESPDYIDIPQPVQQGARSVRRVKGTLPVPREIFPARRVDKPTEKYISAATPLPSNVPDIDSNDPHVQYIGWKRRMADMRRKNFREGLLELRDRKQRTDKRMEQESLAKQLRRKSVLGQPERADEKFTRPSVIQDMLPKHTSTLPDPGREERLANSRARFEAKNARKAMEQQDSLQALYMNARNFITTEAQLAAEIERAFPEGENEAWRNDHQQGENIWNLGMPPTVQSIVGDTKKNEAARWDLVQGRVKKLGEELTGGKL
ncbi:hypothetical protein EYZ11_002413 [Aspergillus tanneri]|uniref:Uncharacterized protein n=1 Tax=Aspergillus tanneri TaxID=1220188 RepID=A0A4S3JR59_9EURO|nr:uncharacterized protein ATNIH1004_004833 [Aspergillus tanneri]KAA8648944.1 hypothetical protein ATNIH1004_004833 [Aspergillus tanneri]THC98125.1 hypothetical protein EYZ11_002413 [Aspergillus tanneri]